MFDRHIENVPYDLLPLITEEYDDMRGADCVLTGNAPLCRFDITTASYRNDVYERKTRKLEKFNTDESNILHAYKKEYKKEEDEWIYKPTVSLNTIPHLFYPLPKK